MSRSRVVLSGLLLSAVTATLLATSAEASASAPSPPAALSPAVIQADANQASLVTDEDERIVDVRSLTAQARAQHSTLINAPYRLRTGSSYTLVLTARTLPYTLNNLLQLAPQTFVEQPDGSYLLSENLYVDEGATLQLVANSAPLRIKLQSSANGFVSIVSFGGALDFEGQAAAPVSIESWDPVAGAPDRAVADGRAYIRGIGGTVTMNYVHVSDLGFWSGRTGGVAITGDDRPHVATVGSSSAATQTYGTDHHPSKYAVRTGAAAAAAASAKAAQDARLPTADGALQPAGVLDPSQAPGSLGIGFQYAEGSVQHSSFDGNAFGLFVSGAKNFLVSDSSFTHSIYSGMVVHRYVTSALLQGDTSSANGLDGFDVTRAATSVEMLQDNALDNGAIGFSINGNPLATTESAAGMALTAYGNHMIANSTATGNGTVGIEINGALNSVVESSVVTHSPMGIVVRGTAKNITVSSNRIDDIANHGIAIEDGVTGATVEGNTVDNSATGVYVRASTAAVSHNSIDGGAKHAISLVGHVGRTSVTYNTLRGRGDGAIDIYRVTASSVTLSGNNASGWVDLRIWTRHLKQLVSPLSLLWLGVLVLIAVTAVRGRRKRSAGDLPYANSRSLSPRTSGTTTGSTEAPTPPPPVPPRPSSPAFDPRNDYGDTRSRPLWVPRNASVPKTSAVTARILRSD